MQWKMRRLLAAVMCAVLAAACLTACGRGRDETEDSSGPVRTPAAPTPADSSSTPVQQAEELWLSILQEGQELTAAARRYFRRMGEDTGIAVHYPHEVFVPDETVEEGLVLRGSLPAGGPECGLTVTVYDQPGETVAQQLLDEHPLTRQPDTLVGAAELPAICLTGTETGGEEPLAAEYYLVERDSRTYAVLLYYAPDRQAEVRPWLQAMLNTVEFADQ